MRAWDGEGPPAGAGGEGEESDPRARSNNAQPLKAAPSVKQLDGLTCARKVTTSAGGHDGFSRMRGAPKGPHNSLGIADHRPASLARSWSRRSVVASIAPCCPDAMARQWQRHWPGDSPAGTPPCKDRADCRWSSILAADLGRRSVGVVLPRSLPTGLAVLVAVRPSSRVSWEPSAGPAGGAGGTERRASRPSTHRPSGPWPSWRGGAISVLYQGCSI
jgi:hypothetical protein